MNATDTKPEQTYSTRNLVATAVVLLSLGALAVLYYLRFGISIEEFGADVLSEALVYLAYAAPFPIALYLNHRWPADDKQKLLGQGVAIDVVYFAMRLALRFSLLLFMMPVLRLFYDRFLPFLTISVSEELPGWFRLLILLLFVDFLAWFHHFVRHKIHALWLFHAVHHSQREMNYFTDARVHIFDRVFASVIIFIPSFMLQIPAPQVFALALVMEWLRLLYHSNFKTNYGWLRYILVTPQSHRIHHSTHPEHQNKNLGINFSIWDHMFGTQYRNYDEYPETGVEDEAFPADKAGSILAVLDTFGGQFLYPFEALWKAAKARFLTRQPA